MRATGASEHSPTPPAVYLDHAATSWPKPAEVIEAVVDALTIHGGNPGRGAHSLAVDASRVIFEARAACASYLGVPDARDILFLPSCTHACNLMLKGTLKPGDRVVVGSMEHNAVARPLHVLASQGVELRIVDADPGGVIDADAVEHAAREAPTAAIVCQHASNVTGAIQPLGDLADVAHEAGAVLLVDGAQGAGHLPVDVLALGVDAYAASGHKGLLGPQGVGVLYLSPELQVAEAVQGGTGGGGSDSLDQPSARPDRYEAGTPNTPGIAGLGAAVQVLVAEGAAARSSESMLASDFMAGVLEMGGYRLLGPAPDEPRVPIVSLVPDGRTADEVAFLLERKYGIAVRAGLHCAPWAHRTLGTLDCGAVRFSFGRGNTAEHVCAALQALRELAE